MTPDDPDTRWAHPIAIGIVGAALMFALGMRKESSAHRPVTGAGPAARVSGAVTPPKELHVPHVTTPPKIDGELDEPDWTRAPARTGAFVAADGAPARPFSEARLLWDEKNLYIALYAADEDIRVANANADGPLWTGDAFAMTMTRADGSFHTIDIGASGTVTDGAGTPGTPVDYTWQSGAVVATDVDGTVDDSRDHDEEWIVELAVPLASLGITGRHGERIGFDAKRCDTVGGKRVCGAWGKSASGAVLVLD